MDINDSYSPTTNSDAFAELFKEVDQLQQQVSTSQVPDGLKEKVDKILVRLKRMARFGGYTEEFEKVAHYVDWILNIPWQKSSEDHIDLQQAKQILRKYHYGMQQVENHILEYLAVLKLNKDKNQPIKAPIILLVGLVGTGKTSFGPALAEAMGREYARIPFGGMGSALDLRGQSRMHLESEPGKVIKALRQAKTRNPVILLDEIDRVSEDARNDIMGVLVELLDPGQNKRFIDHYIDYPVDLSQVLFIATSNNTRNIATAVLDRMEVVQMPSYTDSEKIVIAQKYLFPSIMKEAGMSSEQLTIDDNVWPKIVRPLGYDSGIRTLSRTIKSVVYKIARLIVEGKGKSFHLNQDNIQPFLPQY